MSYNKFKVFYIAYGSINISSDVIILLYLIRNLWRRY